jgi:hypothetical protein
MRSFTLFIALLFSACATPPPPQVTGRYAASLSTGDVEQITALLAARPDLGRTIRKLQAVRPDRVHVEAGQSDGPTPRSSTGFFVVRNGTQWQIERPVEASPERTITIH